MKLVYEKRFGSFYFLEITEEGHETILNMVDQVAVAYDSQSFTMFKHGSLENIENWVSDARKKYIQSGYSDMAYHLRWILLPRDISVEELNKFVNNTGYFGLYIRRNHLDREWNNISLGESNG